MKKICMCLLVALFVCNAYATTDIAADATTGDCDATTLGTYSGSADLEIKWEPNELKLRWYNNNTLMQDDALVHDNVNANTCEYDGTLSRPTNPTRNGYNFTGWKVRPMMDFSSLAIGDNALTSGSDGQRWAKGYVLSSVTDYCWYDVGTTTWTPVNCKTTPGFASLNQQEWKVKYNSGNTTGILYGTAYCSAKNGDYHGWAWPAANHEDWLATTAQLEDATGTKQYCWCQATGWQPENTDTIYANLNDIQFGQMSIGLNSTWVFRGDDSSASSCAASCATVCSSGALNSSAFRRALFVCAGN